jgi:hypothetical protein
MTTIDDRVAAGAAWLDANRPGWWQRINLATLDLGDPCRCVLGQDFGGFGKGVSAVGGDLARWMKTCANLGFYSSRDAAGTYVPTEIEREYAALTAAWRTLITARRNAEDPWAHWADEPDAAPAVWPDRTHDGQRMRDTETADVNRGVL